VLFWYLTRRNLSGLHQSIYSAEARQNITLDVVMRLPGLLEIGLQTLSFAKSTYLAAAHILYNSQGLRHSSLGLYNLRGSESVVTYSSNPINSDTREQYTCVKRTRFRDPRLWFCDKWVPITTAWCFLSLRTEERPPYIEGSCECIE